MISFKYKIDENKGIDFKTYLFISSKQVKISQNSLAHQFESDRIALSLILDYICENMFSLSVHVSRVNIK